MDTPPQPSFSQSETGRRSAKKNITLARTIKTPFQNAALYQRSFKSEMQPNRVSSRFNINNNTSFKPGNYLNRETNIISRLKLNILPKNAETLKPATTPNIRLTANSATTVRNHHHQNNILAKVNNNTNGGIGGSSSGSSSNNGNNNNNNINANNNNNNNQTQHTHYTHYTRTQQQHTRTQQQAVPPLDSVKYQVLVNDKTYKILRKIGSGGSAKVYEGFEPQSSQTVAIKIINVGQSDQRTRDSYFNEKSLLERLRDSRHVVRMYDSEYKQECKELVIVMEKGDADLAQVIDLHFKRKDPTTRIIDGIFIKFYWRGMVQAVHDIHRHGIVHADLKPVNFILVKNEIKLIDFGIANEVEPEVTSIIRDYQIGTINYMAPEALRNRATDASFRISSSNDIDENNPQPKRTVIKYNSKADIWSLGCILYNLVYGRPPFDKYKDLISKVQVIINPKQSICFPEISDRNLMNCMGSCLRYNPAERPTAQELLNDPFLTGDNVVILQK